MCLGEREMLPTPGSAEEPRSSSSPASLLCCPNPGSKPGSPRSQEEENVCCSIALSWGLALSASGAQRLHQDPGIPRARLAQPCSILILSAAGTASFLLLLGLKTDRVNLKPALFYFFFSSFKPSLTFKIRHQMELQS